MNRVTLIVEFILAVSAVLATPLTADAGRWKRGST